MTGSRSVLCEVCVDSVAGAIAAENAGADRLELCAELTVGGLTPSAGLLRETLARVEIPVFAMLRCRAGDFVYDSEELDTMLADAAFALEAGVSGIVFGALEADRTIDVAKTRAICAAVDPLPVTFHRAFDQAGDPLAALDAVIDAGCARLLTSGQRSSAADGAPLIAELERVSNGRLIVIPGAGIRPDNVAAVLEATHCREIHFSGRRSEPSRCQFPAPNAVSFSARIDERDRPRTSEALVAETVRNARD